MEYAIIAAFIFVCGLIPYTKHELEEYGNYDGIAELTLIVIIWAFLSAMFPIVFVALVVKYICDNSTYCNKK